MRLMAVALVAAFAAGAVSTASAQDNPRLRRVQPLPQNSTTVVTRDEYGRTRTRILVQKRSYLDGGTEVLPGDNVNSFRSTFMSYRPGSAATQNTAFDRPGWWNDPYFFPSQRNPYPWSGN